MTYRGAISLNVRLLPGSNITLTGGTSDGAGGVYLTSDVTITAAGGGGGSYSAGTGLTLTGSVFAVAFGTSSTTVCVGNDSRVTGAVQSSTLTTRGDLFVRGASTIGRLAIGSSGQVLRSDGTDPAWYTLTASDVGALATSALSSATPAALGTAAAGTSSSVSRADHVHQIPTAADVGADASGAAAAVLASSAQRASNLSDLASASTARTNLGLGTAATYAATAFDAAGAAATALASAEAYADAGDATTLASAKSYSDALANGLDPKASAYAIETASNITLSGTQTVGGVSCGPGTRVLLTAQTAGAENGLWLTAAGAWSRPSDATTGNLTCGAHTFGEAGTQAGAEWLLTTADPITVGTTAQTWVPYRKMQLSSATPQPLGSATPGSAGQASDAGHVHAMPTAADVGALATSGGTLTGDLTLATTKRLLAGTNVLVGAVADKLNAALMAIASQAVGDTLYADTTTTFARLAAGATDTVQRIVGGVPTWSTLTSLLDTLGSTRGQLLRRGASSWSALGAATADTFVGGDGTDVTTRTASQVRGSLGLPTSFTTAYALLQVNASRTGWQEYVQTIVDEPWNRPDPSTTTAGTVFVNKRDNTAQLCSGLAAVASVPGTGWIQQLPTRLGDDRAGITVNSAQIYSGSTNLSAYTLGNATIVVLFSYDGTLSGTAAAMIGAFGDTTGATRGCLLFLKANAGNIDLIAYTNSTSTTLKSSWNPATGIHRVACAPIAGNKWRFTYDGNAVGADVNMAAAYVAPSTTDTIAFASRSSSNSPMLGNGIDMLVFNSQMSSADMATITTAPGTETYQLAETSSTGAAAIRVQACRFDPSFPTVLPCRGGLGVMTVAGSPVKVNY